jgi:hypothetical protein
MNNIIKFCLLIILLIIFNIIINPKKSKEKYNGKQKLKSVSFKAVPTSSEKIVFSNSNGDLNTYTKDEVFSDGIKIGNTISFNDWTISQDSSKNLCFKRNDQTKNICLTSNDTDKNYSLTLGNTVLDETSLKKQKHLDLLAGFAVDGTGTTFPIYIGKYKLFNSDWGDAYTNDSWDIIYVNKGFKITVWQHEYTGTQAVLENKDSDIPKRFNLSNSSLVNQVSTVQAEWIGY